MVEQVVAELSSFRKAASQANEYVSQLFSGLLPSASKTSEASRELSATAKASSRNDDRIRSESNEAAAAASETADLGKQILSELKDFSKNFTSLISGESGSFVDSIFGMGLGGVGLTALSSLSGGNDLSLDEPAYDLSYDPSNTAPYATEGGGEVVQSQAGIRNGTIDENLLNIISASAAEAGVNVNVISGGQMSLKAFTDAEGSKKVVNDTYYLNGKAVRTGSTRHDNGGAADLDLLDPNTGQILEYNNETQHIFHNFMKLTKQYGATGIGFGFGRNDGYMGGDRMHIGFGADAFWGEAHEDEGTIAAAIDSITPGSKSLPKPTSETPEDEMALDTPQAQETNDVTQVARNDVETNAQQTAEITQALFSNPETPGMPETSIAMAETDFEAVNFEPEKTIPTPAADLSSPATNYRLARLPETSPVRSVVSTPAVNYSAPKEITVASTGLPATRTPKPLDIRFDTNWISEANRKKQKTNETWMA
jgi:hypothetical protein